ncbi:hypothetical protein GFS31_38990 [Leptolyngbya sp. BL0902]|uniref:Hsp20/alpha crystallin family protein n=1 Tax=Leptolyngbya sp. BL0902 TaxID=1115757 RepID=UPI0018E7DDA7|nr:Hsp20/alpha crystallin family protein [Leptolyngbya sp. BL0902]QQE67187.1 hypothetical protein GFS31_38990 [Leptolyngbya sp. BL0902]
MPNTQWSSVWDLAAAQAQLEAITTAIMPLAVASPGRAQVPSIEIQEAEETVIVTAFFPGVDPQAVQVRASATGLTFLGQRQSGYRRPLGQGLSLNYFQHSVPLPAPVHDGAMEVRYSQASLIVALPKRKALWQRGWVILKSAYQRAIARITAIAKSF